eukprot:GHVU01103435.1.p1 GENE.GHVU01103435.1~~GHVU01103435.1.p1  ORF type:complete len:226 (+),score=33.96 GHVU01103435.1:74-679(+)
MLDKADLREGESINDRQFATMVQECVDQLIAGNYPRLSTINWEDRPRLDEDHVQAAATAVAVPPTGGAAPASGANLVPVNAGQGSAQPRRQSGQDQRMNYEEEEEGGSLSEAELLAGHTCQDPLVKKTIHNDIVKFNCEEIEVRDFEDRVIRHGHRNPREDIALPESVPRAVVRQIDLLAAEALWLGVRHKPLIGESFGGF